jgi:hypothetical protein
MLLPADGHPSRCAFLADDISRWPMSRTCGTLSTALPSGEGGHMYNLRDAIEVMKVDGEMILQALNYLPALQQKMNRWTLEDLAEIKSVILIQLVPRMSREERP